MTMPKKIMRLNREDPNGHMTIVPSVAAAYLAFVYLNERDCTPPTFKMLAEKLGCDKGAISSRLFRLHKRGFLGRHPGNGLSRPYYLAGARCRFCHGSGVHHARTITTEKGRVYTLNDLATIGEDDDVFDRREAEQVRVGRDEHQADAGPA